MIDRRCDARTANPTFERSGDLSSLAIGELKVLRRTQAFEGHIN